MSKSYMYPSMGRYGLYQGPGKFVQFAGRRKYLRGKRARRKKLQLPRQMKGIKKQVRELRRLANSDMGVHVHRFRRTDHLTTVNNEQAHKQETACASTKIENVLAELLYYDPSNPSILIKSDGSTGTYHRDYFFTKVTSRIVCRNNYQVPVRLSLFSCVPKADTSINPNTAFVNGLVDVGDVPGNSPLAYLHDSQLFNDLWRIRASKKIVLQPGQQCVMNWTSKPFQYDPSLLDSHNFSYQPVFQAMAWQIFINGVIGHDSVDILAQATLAAGIDYMVDSIFTVKYPAGVDLRQMSIDDGSATFTNLALVTNKPVAENQSFSLT